MPAAAEPRDSVFAKAEPALRYHMDEADEAGVSAETQKKIYKQGIVSLNFCRFGGRPQGCPSCPAIGLWLGSFGQPCLALRHCAVALRVGKRTHTVVSAGEESPRVQAWDATAHCAAIGLCHYEGCRGSQAWKVEGL